MRFLPWVGLLLQTMDRDVQMTRSVGIAMATSDVHCHGGMEMKRAHIRSRAGLSKLKRDSKDGVASRH